MENRLDIDLKRTNSNATRRVSSLERRKTIAS